jgi:hypothetical protein
MDKELFEQLTQSMKEAIAIAKDCAPVVCNEVKRKIKIEGVKA